MYYNHKFGMTMCSVHILNGIAVVFSIQRLETDFVCKFHFVNRECENFNNPTMTTEYIQIFNERLKTWDANREDINYKIRIKTIDPAVFARSHFFFVVSEQWIVSKHMVLFSNVFTLSDHFVFFIFCQCWTKLWKKSCLKNGWWKKKLCIMNGDHQRWQFFHMKSLYFRKICAHLGFYLLSMLIGAFHMKNQKIHIKYLTRSYVMEHCNEQIESVHR